MVYLDSPTTKTGEFPKRGAVLPNATKRVKYSGQKVRTEILKTKHFTIQFLNGAKNTHIKRTCINFQLIFNQQKQVIRFTILVFGNAALDGHIFDQGFTDNFSRRQIQTKLGKVSLVLT